ncbi:hypothetical protein V5E97_07130 [Singulisphaera sp. Ch08]|uniref:Uncharacterized protein n=1 Tax=Singulisphaera sp. Ch08 TaxID=3120278 RepID=A0AAU7CL23_9BACT
MMKPTRRSILSAIGVTLPFGLGATIPFGLGPSARASTIPAAPVLRFRSFEEAVREAFAGGTPAKAGVGQPFPSRRIEIGHSEQVRAGVQGCHNDRPFGGFPAGHLRVIRTGSEPGPIWQGVRLYVSTVDVALTGGLRPGEPSRPLDFASLPPAPTFS